MWFNGASFWVVHIAKGRERQPFSPAEFLADTAIDILNEIIRVILGLTERHLQHEFPLRSWLKPKCRKAQRNDPFGIHEIDDAPTINAISRQSVRMPRQYAHAIAFFNKRHHLVKLFSSWFLCAFRLGKFLDNFHIFSTRIFVKLKELSFNTHNLVVIIFSALASVEKIFWFEHNVLH